MQYYIKKCSVVDIDADIIVNAANCNLLPGGGVCEAIFAKAGEEELLKECKEYGYVNIGQVAVTKGYNTGAKIIIHAVGPAKLLHPDWENLLEMLYRNILYTADDSGLESIAIPCISVGHCGCPLLESTLIAMKVVRDFTPSNLKYCYLCCYTNKEQYTYQVVDCMLKHNISFTEFYNSEQFLLTHISRTKNKYIIFKNNAIYDDNNQPLHKYLFAGCVLSIDVAKYKDIAHTSNLFKTEYDSKEDRLYTYSTAIQDCLQKHNMTIDDYNTYETFIVDQINNTPSKCLALGGAVNMYSIENPDEYTPIFTNLSGKDFDMYMAVSMSSALFYTGPGNMERFISIRETFDTIGLFLYPSKYRRFYPDHNIDCKKYNHIIKNIYRRFHIYHDKTLLQATDNIKELSIYEVATNTLTCTLDDITPIIEKPTHPSLYQLKYKDRSKFILTDKDACVVASSPWVLTITYEETIPTSITTIEQLYNNLIATINNMTPDLRVAQNIPFWKKTTKYNNIIDEFKYLFKQYNAPYILLKGNAILIPVKVKNISRLYTHPIATSTTIQKSSYQYIKRSMGWSSFNKAMAVTNCDDFTFATDIDYKYSSYYMYFITTDKSKTQLDIYPSTKHHIKEQTLPIVKTDGKPFMDVEVLIKPHKLTTKKD